MNQPAPLASSIHQQHAEIYKSKLDEIRTILQVPAGASTVESVAALKAELQQVRNQFNRAIDFAIREGIGAGVFLDAWRHGDTSEWPEFEAANSQAAKTQEG